LVSSRNSRGRPPLESSRAVRRDRPPPSRGAQSRVIRIIGGSLRGRRFRFADIPDIRPTPDRVRETLFNWLGARVAGARCLDLFAGSGALGLEALSRGAATAVLVEQNAVAARALAALIAEWHLQGARVERADALHFLGRDPEPFDIVFLDPPFHAGLLSRSAELLERRGWLAPDALIYVECSAREELPPLPERWQLLKAKRAGEVGYHLLARTEGESRLHDT
jgi:16S rRNA (guanine966-N2)-methyltransferase